MTYSYVATRTRHRHLALAAVLLKQQPLSPLQACCYKERALGFPLTARRAVPIELTLTLVFHALTPNSKYVAGLL